MAGVLRPERPVAGCAAGTHMVLGINNASMGVGVNKHLQLTAQAAEGSGHLQARVKGPLCPFPHRCLPSQGN